MKLGNILNPERIKALNIDSNAYISAFKPKQKNGNTTIQSAEKVVFPEPYENANHYYSRHEFAMPPSSEPHDHQQTQHVSNNIQPMFDIKSLLPMLMSGKFNDMLKPLMSMFGGGNSGSGMDITKIFELFKPKSKQNKSTPEEDVSSKFDDFVIIED